MQDPNNAVDVTDMVEQIEDEDLGEAAEAEEVFPVLNGQVIKIEGDNLSAALAQLFGLGAADLPPPSRSHAEQLKELNAQIETEWFKLTEALAFARRLMVFIFEQPEDFPFAATVRPFVERWSGPLTEDDWSHVLTTLTSDLDDGLSLCKVYDWGHMFYHVHNIAADAGYAGKTESQEVEGIGDEVPYPPEVPEDRKFGVA